MNIASLLGTNSGASTQSSSVADNNAATKDQFLKLLMAQLKNQDPLSSPDVDKIAEQITQFGQLEQLMNLNSSMEEMSVYNWAMGRGQDRDQAISLIGKTVGVENGTINVAGGTAGSIGYNLAGDADTVEVSISTEAGQVVRKIKYNNVPAGVGSQAFDGRSDGGAQLPDGTYKVSITATNDAGEPVATSTLGGGVVSGVDMRDDGIWINVDGKTYSMDQIHYVRS